MPSYRIQEIFHDLREGVPSLNVKDEFTDPAGNSYTGVISGKNAVTAKSATHSSVPSVTQTKLGIDTVVSGNTDMLDGANSQVVIPEDGTYIIAGAGMWQSDAAWTSGDTQIIYTFVNGSQVARHRNIKHGTAQESCTVAAVAYDLNEGDTVDLRAYQDSGSNLVVLGDRHEIAVMQQ